MIKTSLQIELDYFRAIKQAKQLEEIANDLEDIEKRQLNDANNSIICNWNGSNATKWIAKSRKVENEMRVTTVKLRKVAATIRTIAKNTKEADLNALRLAQKRVYRV